MTCMKTVALRSQETVSGLKGYVAAGTCLMQGEEVTCRGRVSSTQQQGASYFWPSCKTPQNLSSAKNNQGCFASLINNLILVFRL